MSEKSSSFLSIQAKEGSLEGYTMTDAVISEGVQSRF